MSFITDLFKSPSSVTAPTVTYNPSGFRAGGIKATSSGNITESPERIGLVQGAENAYGGAATELGKLRQTVGPGFNDLLNARLADLANQQTSAIGNLRQNLASRRILGSSFGQDTINNLNATFNQQRDQAIANNFLDSLNANAKLLDAETQARANQFNAGLNDLNLQADIGTKISQSANQILAQNAQVNAKLLADAQQGQAKALGSIFGSVAGGLGSAAGSILGPSASAAGNALAGSLFAGGTAAGVGGTVAASAAPAAEMGVPLTLAFL